MKQLILRFLRLNLRVMVMSSLCIVVLSMATFTPSSTKAIRRDSQPNHVLRSDQPMNVAAGITLTVNTLGDAADINVGDGLCDTGATAGDQCTLRSAIQETNFATTDDVINFSLPASSTITLMSALDGIVGGNLDINGPGGTC